MQFEDSKEASQVRYTHALRKAKGLGRPRWTHTYTRAHTTTWMDGYLDTAENGGGQAQVEVRLARMRVRFHTNRLRL